MSEVPADVAREASALIEQLRSGLLEDEGLSRITVRLNQLLPDPNWFSYTIDRVPELTPDEVIQKAFSYRPIRL